MALRDIVIFSASSPLKLCMKINKKVQEEVQEEVQDETVGINELSKTEQSTLKILTGGMFSKNEIAEMLGYKSVTGNLRNAFEKLLQYNLIEYTIPDKLRSKNQKYKITKKGTNLLEL